MLAVSHIYIRMIKLKNLISENLAPEGVVYHVTRKRNLPTIKKYGILPSDKFVGMTDFGAVVFLFNKKEDMEDAMMNWMGDRFSDDEELVLLTINPKNIDLFPSDAGFEVITDQIIPWKNIVKIEKI